MLISDIRSRTIGDQVEVSAMVDDFRLWYRFPADCPYVVSPNPFVAAAFFPAALRGETVKVDSTAGASPTLLEGIAQLQEIFGSWRKDLLPFDVECRTEVVQPNNERVCAFFSGGIDGLYTLGHHEDEITDLVYINGFDFEMSPDEFASGLQRVRQLASLYGKTVTPVETNFYEFNRQKSVSRPWTHGSCLASVALAVGFSKWYIASSYTYYELHPWGSHPLTDRLWSTEAVRIVHDSAVHGRAEKIRDVVRKKPEVFDSLVVCWDLPDANCGECNKCVRTMVSLSILGVDSPSFPKKFDPENMPKLALSRDEPFFFEDNLALAKSEHNRPMQEALEKVMRPSRVRQLVKGVDRVFFGGSLREISRRLSSMRKGKGGKARA